MGARHPQPAHTEIRPFRRWDLDENIAWINETETIRRLLVGASMSAFLDVLFSLIYIAVIYTLSPTLTAVILISIPIQALVYFSFGPLLRGSLQNRFDASAAHQSNLVENISGIDAIKATAAEEQTYDRLSTSEDSYLDDLGRFRQLESDLTVQLDILSLDRERSNLLRQERDAFVAEIRNALWARHAEITGVREGLCRAEPGPFGVGARRYFG